jgi:hypothetical protein
MLWKLFEDLHDQETCEREMCHVVRITALHLTSFNYQVSSSTGQKILWEYKYRPCPQKQVYVKRYEHVFNKSEIIVIQITFNDCITSYERLIFQNTIWEYVY